MEQLERIMGHVVEVGALVERLADCVETECFGPEAAPGGDGYKLVRG